MPSLPLFPFWVLHSWDSWRRLSGLVLDQAGLGVQPAPSKVIFTLHGARVRAYAEPGQGSGPAVLLVPAPIKDASVWDLGPEASPVRRLLEAGLRPYVLEWEDAGRRVHGLAGHVSRILAPCVDAVAAREGGVRPFVAGHSLGGVLLAILMAAYPDAAQGLILIEAPLVFTRPGAEDPFTSIAKERELPPKGGPSLSGTGMSLLSAAVRPDHFVWDRWADAWMAALGGAATGLRHARVERWSLSERPIPPVLLGDMMDFLYRQDALFRDGLEVEGRIAALNRIRTSVVMVSDPDSRLVPWMAQEAALKAMASNDKTLLLHHAELGSALGHLSPLVGEEANRSLWPRLALWMKERAELSEEG